jgi:hypothetical protein
MMATIKTEQQPSDGEQQAGAATAGQQYPPAGSGRGLGGTGASPQAHQQYPPANNHNSMRTNAHNGSLMSSPPGQGSAGRQGLGPSQGYGMAQGPGSVLSSPDPRGSTLPAGSATYNSSISPHQGSLQVSGNEGDDGGGGGGSKGKRRRRGNSAVNEDLR